MTGGVAVAVAVGLADVCVGVEVTAAVGVGLADGVWPRDVNTNVMPAAPNPPIGVQMLVGIRNAAARSRRLGVVTGHGGAQCLVADTAGHRHFLPVDLTAFEQFDSIAVTQRAVNHPTQLHVDRLAILDTQ